MPRSTCGACKKIFTSTSLFDAHRVGGFGEAIYENEAMRKARRSTGKYTPPTRRCLTTEELIAQGYAIEHKTITVLHDGVPVREEADVWYDPVAREMLRAAYQNETDEDAAD